MWVMAMAAVAAYAVIQQSKPRTVDVVDEAQDAKEPTLGQRTFTDKTGLPFVPDPVVERPPEHLVNGLANKAKYLKHTREVRDVQNLSESLGF